MSLPGLSQAQQPPPQKPPEEPPPVLSVPKNYRYNARGRRDPFVNPVPKPVQRTGGAPPPPPQCPQPQGLKGVLVAQAAISGVVTSREPSMNIVIIGAPGGKTYFARVGDALCDAVVTGIKLDTVTFALTVPGAADQKPREIVRKVRPTPGEQK
ncbi:MAG TPA: hypothetical protein VER98_16075 [Terriglobia bacterium]|nr:hypothetical protein [Terriglobia bacterium]